MRLAGACLLLMAIAAVARADRTFEIAVVSNEKAQRNGQVVAALRQHLVNRSAEPPDLTILEPAAAAAHLEAHSPDLTIAVGSQAGRAIARLPKRGATLFGFLPSAVWRELQACCDVGLPSDSALFIDQPGERLLRLVRLILPDAKKVAILFGKVSQSRQAELVEAAAETGLELLVRKVDESGEVGSMLRQLVRQADVLLALPDPTVYNRNTVYPILLTTYSARIPVIGFSEAMVRAGSSAAVFASPADAGKAIANAVQTYRTQQKLAPASWTDVFSIATNPKVLKSLRLEPIPDSRLLEQLKEPLQ
jgi:hypothetical protein